MIGDLIAYRWLHVSETPAGTTTKDYIMAIKRSSQEGYLKHSYLLSKICDSAISNNLSEVGHQLNQPENQGAPSSSAAAEPAGLNKRTEKNDFQFFPIKASKNHYRFNLLRTKIKHPMTFIPLVFRSLHTLS